MFSKAQLSVEQKTWELCAWRLISLLISKIFRLVEKGAILRHITHTYTVYHFDRYLANYDRRSRFTHVCMSSYKVIDDIVSPNKKVQQISVKFPEIKFQYNLFKDPRVFTYVHRQ